MGRGFMAINVNLYSFAKKINSTKEPTSTPLVLPCVLKDECSMQYPVLGIDNGSTWNPQAQAYNYAFIGAFQRFYFVTSWTYKGGLWWASLEVDTLATERTRILGSTQYVARSAIESDPYVIDGFYPATAQRQVQHSYWNDSQHPTPWTATFSSGFYVVGIINSDDSSVGCVSYYAFTVAQFQTLKDYLLSDSTWTGIMTTNPDLGDNLYKSLFNPFQYITSAIWFPFSMPSGIGSAVSDLKFGWWELSGISCTRLTTFRHVISGTLKAKDHPNSTRGAYLRCAPFTRYQLIAPPWGEFDLDANLIGSAVFTNSQSDIFVDIDIDYITGEAEIFVSCSVTSYARAILLKSTTMLGVPAQLAQITNNEYGQISNVISTVANVATSLATLNIGGAVGAVSNGIMNSIDNAIPHAQQMGSDGNLTQYNIAFALHTISAIPVDESNVEYGRPLCKYRQLSTLQGGFVQCIGSHVEIYGTLEESRKINEFLDNGVYLE